uniref:Uncharacterized protein n=1 Tax=Arion vulgaris TaxID=1028688 RepID=A0A0B7BNN5_9EUPU
MKTDISDETTQTSLQHNKHCVQGKQGRLRIATGSQFNNYWSYCNKREPL